MSQVQEGHVYSAVVTEVWERQEAAEVRFDGLVAGTLAFRTRPAWAKVGASVRIEVSEKERDQS